mmetsp:Transcript_13123/g.34324  ORF Transcript_13123/g.34324 Transcript_13123/m.34324 type:complete len:136 (-) Transcript_13123:222-629(-)|eukprot:CAMPEP_0113881504 /NCGR_PEP_ID=MMETSP0780_2-20120614/8415_1 /TAXON_ID=652834 /ORGANISM="Palpitomonas bilix" /LENGTH=135 /DNA_ID=CAMNT_0000868373 /DNA_START=278 /DNA_END=685 /DNA_ORIENTATION=- /assembly_acc=CAM_ASM_000599
MVINWVDFLYLIIVALFWGSTNPLLKKGSKGVAKTKSKGSIISIAIDELRFLLLNWKFLGAFALNQAGSLLYYYLLGSSELRIAVPVVNALTIVVTAISGAIMGEKINNITDMVLGCILVGAGVFLCAIGPQGSL